MLAGAQHQVVRTVPGMAEPPHGVENLGTVAARCIGQGKHGVGEDVGDGLVGDAEVVVTGGAQCALSRAANRSNSRGQIESALSGGTISSTNGLLSAGSSTEPTRTPRPR